MKRVVLLTCALSAGAALSVHNVAIGQGTGTIEGRVLLTAAAPPNALIRMGADPNCLKINAGKRVVQEVVLRDANGGLQNVFVNLQGSFPQSAVPAQSVTIDQQGCTYHPRVQGARVGQTLEVKNDDETLHNIHSLTTKDNAFNTGQPKAGMVFKFTLKSEEVMLHVRCDVHPWMSGYVGVLPHPYFAVTAETGAFKIANVPPGKYTIQGWHERYGALTAPVEVKAGATATVDLTYTGSEKAPAGAAGALMMQELHLPAGVSAASLAAPAAP